MSYVDIIKQNNRKQQEMWESRGGPHHTSSVRS